MVAPVHRSLRERREDILRQWRAALVAEGRDGPGADTVSGEEASDLVDALAAWVGDEGGPAAERLAEAGVAYANRRVRHGRRPERVIDDVRVLRGAILELIRADATERARAGGREVCDRLALRVNAGLDLALSRIVAYCGSERERALSALGGANEALRDREAFLRKVLDATPSMVFVKNADGRFVLGNQALARIYGTTVGALVGKTDDDFNPNAAQPVAFRRDDREVMRTRREKHIPEEQVTTAEGEVRWFSTVKVPLVNEDGSCDHVLGVSTDITERKRAEDALRSADRQKDHFLAMLAHELRNPLAAISSAAQVIRTRFARGESAERALQVLERQVRNSARLLEDLLDVSRVTRGALRLRKQPVRLDAIVASAVDAQRQAIDAARLRLTISMPREPVLLDADPTRLEQVVSNLLHNAAKYTPEHGRVALTAERERGEVAIRVEDSGIGIAPDLLPRIFDPFVQAEQSLARTQGGLGLGLALVRQLVEMHGGSVEARSEGPGKGSEFVVRLPTAVSRSGAGEPTQPTRTTGARRRRRILIVEDNVDLAELLADHLGSLGHDVAVTHDGPSAIDAAARTPPDVALVDIGLPRMDGYEVGRRLRAAGGDRPPVLVAMTGYGQEEDRRRSREAGFVRHLTKPFPPRTLEELLAELPGERAA